MTKRAWIGLAALTWGVAVSCAAGADLTEDAMAYLSARLGNENQSSEDSQQARRTWVALRATKDPDLAPLFVAMSKSNKEINRRFAVAALGEFCGQAGVEALRLRVAEDSVAAVRGEALARLMDMKEATVEDLQRALKDADETVQVLAARGLARAGQGDAARPSLEKLAGSNAVLTARIAQLTMVALGDRRHMDSLTAAVKDPKMSERQALTLLSQIEDDKIVGALDLVNAVLEVRQELPVRVQAYRALSAVSPTAAADLLKASQGSSDTVARVNILNILAARSDATDALRTLAGQEDAPGLLARFELARPNGGEEARKAAQAAMATQHPVVIDYILESAAEDLKDHPKRAGFYVPVLLAYLESVSNNSPQMRREHIQAAQATTVLVDLGTPEALAGVKKALAGRYGSRVRAVGAGLLKAENKSVAELAQPLLQSPYEDLVTDGSLTLGRMGHDGARNHFSQLLARHKAGQASSSDTALLTLASWYSLKIARHTRLAVEILAKQVK